MSNEAFRGQYICYGFWTIVSFIFFFCIFDTWINMWVKIISGIVQLGCMIFFTLGFYNVKKKKNFWMCVCALIVDIVASIAIINYITK